jgi:alpha-tubulin suppressor-like RCC1 family protein
MGTFVLAAHGTSAAVCSNGQLYSWGCGGDAHLDQANRIHNQTTSRPDDDGTGTRTGAWGGRGNRLGHGEDKGTKDVPTLVRGAMCGRRVMCVSGGAYVTAAVTSDGHLFTWVRHLETKRVRNGICPHVKDAHIYGSKRPFFGVKGFEGLGFRV